jgi:hypothetical protein
MAMHAYLNMEWRIGTAVVVALVVAGEEDIYEKDLEEK